MTTASIPVDLFNPGQVFACYGLMELAEVLVGSTTAGFDWSEPGAVKFLLRAEGPLDPIAAGLEFLAHAELHTIVPPAADGTEKWDVASRSVACGDTFPVPPPSSPAALPAVLSAGGRSITISSWGEGRVPDRVSTQRDNLKFWAGSGGYPGAGLLRDALKLIRPHLTGARHDPFSFSAPQSSSLRFDWRRDYIPIDIGFSLNAHGAAMQPRGYPLVEMLAVIGLSHARPMREKKLKYRYAVAGRADRQQHEAEALLPPPLLRAALGTSPLPFATRNFCMHLDWPGQENQARCITTVQEEIDDDDRRTE